MNRTTTALCCAAFASVLTLTACGGSDTSSTAKPTDSPTKATSLPDIALTVPEYASTVIDLCAIDKDVYAGTFVSAIPSMPESSLYGDSVGESQCKLAIGPVKDGHFETEYNKGGEEKPVGKFTLDVAKPVTPAHFPKDWDPDGERDNLLGDDATFAVRGNSEALVFLTNEDLPTFTFTVGKDGKLVQASVDLTVNEREGKSSAAGSGPKMKAEHFSPLGFESLVTEAGTKKCEEADGDAGFLTMTCNWHFNLDIDADTRVGNMASMTMLYEPPRAIGHNRILIPLVEYDANDERLSEMLK